MSEPLLATKLHIPPLRSAQVGRARLVAYLERGRQRRLTLISAPAGFGKTTLVSEWVAACGCPAAWLSLDERDGDLTSFLAYLVAALQGIGAPIGAELLGALQSPQPPPPPALLTLLLNDINRIPHPFIVILDDYHTLDSPAIDEALTFLLDHLPPQMHLVIATREDPPLPLARLRARDQLSEVRAADLRFSADEAAAFFNHGMKLALEQADIDALQQRTEGWIAGLQLAALALQGARSSERPSDAAGFIRAFTGSHRFVLDYLVEEVLQRQPAHIQHFLLSTAILDRLCGPLCDAVLADPERSGQAALAYCEQANLLLVPLDDSGGWYRYHHLFGEVLRARLMKVDPERVPTLHQRASDWYAQHGFPTDAIQHAFAAHDVERAGALVERTWPGIRRTRQEAAFRRWVMALPDDLIRQRPVLSVVCAWALLDAGEYDAAEARLRAAEQLLDAPPDQRVVIDEEQFRSLPATIANARAYRAQALNDIPATVAYTRQALDLLPESDFYERGTTAALLGLAYWASGSLEAAYQSFAQGLADLQRGGGILIRMGGTLILAHMQMAQGHLHAAANAYRQALQVSAAHGDPPLKGTAEMYLGLSEIALDQGDRAAARAHFLTGTALREQASLPGYEHLWSLIEARLHHSDGALDAAFDRLAQAERQYYRSPIPDVWPIAALRARLLIRADRLAEAQAWARDRGLSASDELSYLREYEHLTLARLLLAQSRQTGAGPLLADALALLDRLLHAAEAGERTGSILEILMLQALAVHAQGDLAAALTLLGRSLTLAEQDGHVAVFVDEGAPLARLLEKAAAHGLSPHAGRVLAALGAQPPQPAPLADMLSERELEVLRLLATDLSGPEIAETLGVALSTIRTHTKNIYSKLDASSRRTAVSRAEALGLI